MAKSFAQIPAVVNEEVKAYAPGSKERAELLETYKTKVAVGKRVEKSSNRSCRGKRKT